MPESVTLVECPRDAFQGLQRFIPTETKIDYLLSLIDAGFKQIDFGSFVSAKAVPQMQDTRQVLEGVRQQLGQTRLIAIVPNLKGLEAAIEARDIRFAGYAFSVSETFQQRNFRQTQQQAWAITGELLSRARAAGMDLVVYLSMAFGNPYGDPWSPSGLLLIVEKLVEMGVRKNPAGRHSRLGSMLKPFMKSSRPAPSTLRTSNWECICTPALTDGKLLSWQLIQPAAAGLMAPWLVWVGARLRKITWSATFQPKEWCAALRGWG